MKFKKYKLSKLRVYSNTWCTFSKMQDNKNICSVSPLQEEPINFNDKIVGLCKVICFQLRQIYQNMKHVHLSYVLQECKSVTYTAEYTTL